MMAVTVRTTPRGVEADTPHELFSARLYFTGHPNAVMADGQKFLVVNRALASVNQAPLTIITNWPATLRK